MDMYGHVWTCIDMYGNVWTNPCIHTSTYIGMYQLWICNAENVWKYMEMYVHVCTGMCMYMHVCTCMDTYVRVRTCMCVY